MPEILADQDPGPPKAGVEGPDGVAPGEEPALIEQSVGWQVDLVMDVHHLAAREIGRRDVEAVAPVFIHETDQQIDAPGWPPAAGGRLGSSRVGRSATAGARSCST